MEKLTVPRKKNYDDFLGECTRMWPLYLQGAVRVLRTMTPSSLADALLHPDGFVKLSIGPPNGVIEGQVRLHFWIPGCVSQMQPHSHPWHLASLVLTGTYREYQPSLQENDEGDLKKFEVAYPPNEDVRANVRQVGESTYHSELGPVYETAEGHAHFLRAGPVHMSSPTGSGGITLAVMSPRFSDTAYFFAPDGKGYRGVVRQDEIDAIMALVVDARSGLR